MDDPLRILVKHLFVGTGDGSKDDSLTESESILRTLSRLEADLASIVEIGSIDASTIAAIHTTLEHAPGYLLVHPGGEAREIAERNLRTFTSKRALHSAVSSRSYPAGLRGPAASRTYRSLAERVERYHGREDVRITRSPDRRVILQPSSPASALVIRFADSSQPNGSIDQLIDAARHRGYRALALALDANGADHVRTPDLRMTLTPERSVFGYLLAPPVAIETDVYQQLVDRFTGARSNRP